MEKNKSITIGSVLEAIPGILLGFSVGSGMWAFFLAMFSGRHYPYESLAYYYIISFDRVLFAFMTAFVVVKLLWMKQKKQYLYKMFVVSWVGAAFGTLVTALLSSYGSRDLVNSIWGI